MCLFDPAPRHRGDIMKLITTALVLLSLAVVSPAYSATEQQNKMATCNKDATGKKGDERKAFMKECLSKKPEAPAEAPKNSQQSKMATCNKDAAGKKGDERKQFMSECLKAK
jgi:hypothetical protein